ncbi:MAG: hypothetical protein V1876_03580, partial [Candidatus Peregrinibacteria bacterium]
KPTTSFVTGLDPLPDWSIQVDEYLCAGQDLYAAGDVATFPYPHTGEPTRIEQGAAFFDLW